MDPSLNRFVLIFVCSVSGFVQSQIISKYFMTEEICTDEYGTVLEIYYGVRGKTDCGSRCIEHNCTSFLYNGQSKFCTLNAQTFINRTANGCSFLVYYAEAMNEQINNQALQTGECGEIPILSSIQVNNASGNYSVGSKFPYICTPCTSFPPVGSTAYIECGTDGLWILPDTLCVYGPDIGHLYNGAPIPTNALGCASVYNNTCPSDGGSIPQGLRFDGTVDICYCDGACCNAGDCCYDTTCDQIAKKP